MRPILRFAFLFLMLISGSFAHAAIVVTDAKLSGGRLIVSGTSDFGQTIALDGHYTAEVSNKAFSFSLVYVPASCIVSISAPGTTTPNVLAAVANCAPTPVTPTGAWSAEIRYQPNDLVERQGKPYVALANPRQNLNEDPLYATSFWRAVPMPNATAEQTLLIGPKGEQGVAGRDGVKGDDGALANHVLHMIKADITRPQFENGQPKGDWTITSSGTLAVTVAKGDRNETANLLIPLSTITDIDACMLTATVFETDPDSSQPGLGRYKKQGDMIALPVRTVSETTRVNAILLCPKAK